jgi:hypothetical protein
MREKDGTTIAGAEPTAKSKGSEEQPTTKPRCPIPKKRQAWEWCPINRALRLPAETVRRDSEIED